MLCLYPRPGNFPCGQCMNCLINNQMQWKFRLKKEVLVSDLAFWLTLQYDNEHLYIPEIGDCLNRPAVCKKHCQNYFRQLRKVFKSKKFDIKFKYFLTSEYGPLTNRPHYHCLILVQCKDKSLNNLLYLKSELYHILKEHWYHGHVHESSFHSGVISYLTKYCLKPQKDYDSPIYNFRLISHGIGEKFLENVDFQQAVDLNFKLPEGYLPRYYRDKIVKKLSEDLEYHDKILLKKTISNDLMDIIEDNAKQELNRFNSLEEYFKYQDMLRSHQRRISEKKQKQKYG